MRFIQVFTAKVVTLLMLSLMAMTASAQVTLTSPFYGTWQNETPATREIVKMEIAESAGRVQVHMWFATSPREQPFDAGIKEFTLLTGSAPRGQRPGPPMLRWQGTISTQTLEVLIEAERNDKLNVTLIKVAGPNANRYERMAFKAYEVPTDCLSYDPSRVSISGSNVVVGREPFMSLGDARDRELGAAVMRSFNNYCMIGRDNPRPNRNDYVFEYWTGGANGATAPSHDCIGYDPARIRVANAGAEGYRIEEATAAGTSYLHKFHSQADALAALQIMQQYRFQCYIGRGTSNVYQYLKR